MFSDHHCVATILIGPTGSGKTPLGELIAGRGLSDGPYVHFDFGHQLRLISSGESAAHALIPQDRQIVAEVLSTGRLLKPEEGHLATKILRWFLDRARRQVAPKTPKLVLNGLPRTVDQAGLLEEFIRVERVILLDCDLRTILKRIQKNTGGDRTGRQDDTPELVRFKFEQYLAETKPVVDYYARRQVPVFRIGIRENTSPEELYQVLRETLEKASPNMSLCARTTQHHDGPLSRS